MPSTYKTSSYAYIGVGVLMNWARFGPSIVALGPARFLNLDQFNIWAGLEFNFRVPQAQPDPKITMVLAKIVM